jgi:pantothenate kinase-related protein Tda10
VLHCGAQGVGQPDLSSALTRAAVVHGEATSKSAVEAAYRTYEAQLRDVGTAALLMLAASEAITHTEDNLAGYALV